MTPPVTFLSRAFFHFKGLFLHLLHENCFSLNSVEIYSNYRVHGRTVADLASLGIKRYSASILEPKF